MGPGCWLRQRVTASVAQHYQGRRCGPTPRSPCHTAITVTMRANGSILTLLAVRTEGGASTTVTTKHPNEKSVRGMSERHKTFEAAKARLDILAKDAEKQGWVRGKFEVVSKPDAFSTMPAAPKMVA
jgi:hypothetical protein